MHRFGATVLVVACGAALASAWPRLYPACFPVSLREKFMGSRGEYDASIMSSKQPDGKYKVSCGKAGIIVQNGWFEGSEPHGPCENAHRYSQNVGTVMVSPVRTDRPVSVVCAHNDWSKWKAASSIGPAAFVETEADIVDVLVIGGGLGGTAAAYAAKKAGASSVAVMQAAAASTTSMSTGVVWFPKSHTAAELTEAYGVESSNASHVASYVAGAGASYSYWKDPLDLVVYQPVETLGTSFDYTSYSTGEKRGHSYQPAACADSDDNCGSVALQLLNSALKPTMLTGRAYNVAIGANGVLVVTYDVNGGSLPAGTPPVDPKDARTIAARTVVFAVGGSGRYDNVYASDRILALPENTGIHLKTASDLGLTLSATGLQWHLEFQKIDGVVTPRWFAQRCAPIGSNGSGSGSSPYDLCANYHERSGTYYADYDKTIWLATEESIDDCGGLGAPTSSREWWGQFFDAIGAAELPGSCGAQKEVAGGIIDGKAGFLVEPDTMASASNPQIFGAGTTVAHVLGDTYFSPGSTLGWALHSGRIAGNASAARAAKLKSPQKIKPTLRKIGLIVAFATGTWLILIGVFTHMIAATKWLHYVIMPTAAFTLAFSATVARSRETEAGADRPMEAAHKPHVTLGWVLVVWLVLQTTWGLLLKTGSWTNAGGFLHRISGWLILVLVAWQYMTARHGLKFYDVNRSTVTMGSALYSVLALILLAWGTYRLCTRFSPSSAKPRRAVAKYYVVPGSRF
jgi:hypothetical protein